MTFLREFLQFLREWEAFKGGTGYLSKSTSEGLRVTIESTLGLLGYLSSLGYTYLMTTRLSHDCIERLFGVIRQSAGSNDHPTPTQILLIVNCLSFYNLARAPAGGTTGAGVVNSLLCAENIENSSSERLDALLEEGRLDELREVFEDDHESLSVKNSDSGLT